MEKKYKTRIKRILSSEYKEIDKAVSPLAIMWRRLLMDMGIDINRWNYLMAAYLTNPNSAIGPTKLDRDNARGKLTKALAYTNMSMKVFQSGLKFLQCEYVKFEVTLHPYGNREPSTHAVDIWYGDHKPNAIKKPTPVKPKGNTVINRFRNMLTNGSYNPFSDDDKTMSKPVLDMLAQPDKSIGTATDVLSKLWRQILIDKKIDDTIWNGLMTSYLNRYVPKEADSKSRSNVGGNFNKNLVKNRMTMLIFVRALALLRIESYQLKLIVKRRNLAKTTIHEGKFDVPDPIIKFRSRKTKNKETPESKKD